MQRMQRGAPGAAEAAAIEQHVAELRELKNHRRSPADRERRDRRTEMRPSMPFRRRPLATAAIVGGTAYAAGKAGAKAGAANAAAAQPAPDAAAAPTEAPSTAADPAETPPAVESTADKMDQLAKLKQLLDMQALTQEEFDAQKARILVSM
jgi:Short C-terminal domain